MALCTTVVKPSNFQACKPSLYHSILSFGYPLSARFFAKLTDALHHKPEQNIANSFALLKS